MNYREWEETVPDSIRGDVLWKMKVYRLALFVSRIAWADIGKLKRDLGTQPIAGQLYRALGSIGANIAEGYSRSSGKDRVRMYEYALGSARESREWYYRVEGVLTSSVVEHRLAILSEIIKLILAMLPDQRTQQIYEESETYDPHFSDNYLNLEPTPGDR